jgi:hypothetical protein
MRNYAVIAVMSSVLSATPAVLQAQNTCHPSDNNSSRVISMINGLMASSLSAGRDSAGLPLASPNEIMLVTDSVVCARAGRAVDSVMGVWNPSTQVPPGSTTPLYVFKIGSSFGVLDLNSPNEDAHRIFLLLFSGFRRYSSMLAL